MEIEISLVLLFCIFVILLGISIIMSNKEDHDLETESLEDSCINTASIMSEVPIVETKVEPKVEPKVPTIKSNNKYIKKNIYSSGKVSKGEKSTREIFERLFRRKFPTVRLKELSNPYTDAKLEIDGLCSIEVDDSVLYVGFEYQGEQHYKPGVFNATQKEFEQQKMRDLWKLNKCKELGMIIIEVPYYIKERDREPYILDQLSKHSQLNSHYVS